MQDTFLCKKCGDEVTFFPEDYEDRKHPSYTCGYCEGYISLKDALRDSFYWGGLWGVVKMLWFRLK